MDPKANIEEQRALAYDLIHGGEGDRLPTGERLAELVIALDEWRTNGGFDPYVEPWEGIPTREQGVAFAERMARAKTSYANVSRGGAGLPDEYLLVVEEMHDPVRSFTYGIDREGRISS